MHRLCFFTVQGKGLTLAMTKDEVVAWLGDKICDVKTLDDTHLYCEPPEEQPLSLDHENLPSLKVSALDLDTTQFSPKKKKKKNREELKCVLVTNCFGGRGHLE